MKALVKKTPLFEVNLEEIAEKTERYSGADLAMIVREAAAQVLRENNDTCIVTQQHFYKALTKIKPSVSVSQSAVYEKMKNEHNLI